MQSEPSAISLVAEIEEALQEESLYGAGEAVSAALSDVLQLVFTRPGREVRKSLAAGLEASGVECSVDEWAESMAIDLSETYEQRQAQQAMALGEAKAACTRLLGELTALEGAVV